MFEKYDKIKFMYNVSVLPHNCVLIIDNRPNMMSVISAKLSLSCLKPGLWSIAVVTSQKHYDFYKTHFPTAILLSHPLQEKPTKFDIEDYNKMLKSPNFWYRLAEKEIVNVLLVQDDGFLIREGLEDEFMTDDGFACKYKYVGAPWPENNELKKVGCHTMVGNGGLSLRHVPTMLDVTEKATSREKGILFNMNFQPLPEDVFFSKMLAPPDLPEAQIAQKFASEMILNPDSYGIHKPWGYFPIAQILSNYFKT
jgi:hypothetical protein